MLTELSISDIKIFSENNLTKLKYQQLETSNFYLNLVGLTKLTLNSWEN
jgi:hypothetical protein